MNEKELARLINYVMASLDNAMFRHAEEGKPEDNLTRVVEQAVADLRNLIT